MINQIKIFMFIIFITGSVFAQHPGNMRGKNHRDKLMELEKLKLIEVLDMNEEITLKFFARRNAYLNIQKGLNAKKDSLLRHFEEDLRDNKIDEQQSDIVTDVLNIEKQLLNKRIDFIHSLDDILTKEQVAKYVVFEFRFRKEIRDMFLGRRRNKKMQ